MSILTGRELEFLASLRTNWRRLYLSEFARVLKHDDTRDDQPEAPSNRQPQGKYAMTRYGWMSCLAAAAMLAGLSSALALADETVTVGGSRAVLIKPKAPRGSVILMPGGDGNIRVGDKGDIHGLTGNQLVRTRHAYAGRGLAVLVVDAGTDLSSAVQYMAAIKRPVTVIGTSNGTIRAAQGIARGARPDALGADLRTSQCRVGHRQQRHFDHRLPGIVAAYADHSSLPGWLPCDLAGWRGPLHQMVGRTRARGVDQWRQ